MNDPFARIYISYDSENKEYVIEEQYGDERYAVKTMQEVIELISNKIKKDWKEEFENESGYKLP